MSILDTQLNQPNTWKEMLQNAQRRIEVDLHEVERVIELGRRTPGLADYEQAFQQLSIFFEIATQHYQKNNPRGLADLVAFWERYRAAIVQRYSAITPVELRSADKVVRDVFQRFLSDVPNENIAYSRKAVPLVYGGVGGLGSYFTHPPGWNRPFAIINLPHAAFDNVWQWLALPHEIGHDTYATVQGLDVEIENALYDRMQTEVANGNITMPSVDVDLNPSIPHHIQYSGEEFLALVWQSWANEAQADIVGLLNCGGAALVALQQIVGFRAEDHWEVFATDNGIGDGPEVHPTSYIRNALNIAALRLIGDGHSSLVADIETRFQALRPQTNTITWQFRGIKIASVPVDEMVRSAEIAAEVLVQQKFAALGNKSYQDLGDFTVEDQSIVEAMINPLTEGIPTFAQVPNATPRHALAATVLAFEKDRSKAKVINQTFQHFV